MADILLICHNNYTFFTLYNMMKKITFWALMPLLLTACVKEIEEVEKPLYPTVGAINARYSVSDSVTVVFAKGNLQYQAVTNTWRFAENQYDVIGEENALVDTFYNGWIDLFGWGTSGFDSLMPYSFNDTNTFYVPGEHSITGTNYDWGLYNPISGAGNKAGSWRTLSYDEWHYLLYYRESASMKRGLATILNGMGEGCDMVGYILLPDKWELPSGCAFSAGVDKGFAANRYDMAQWHRMEGAGAVFLPAGGYRDKHKVSLVGEYGCYWTTSVYSEETAYELYFMDARSELGPSARANGHCVRLVQEK